YQPIGHGVRDSSPDESIPDLQTTRSERIVMASSAAGQGRATRSSAATRGHGCDRKRSARLARLIAKLARRLLALPSLAVAHPPHVNCPVGKGRAENHDKANIDHEPEPAAECSAHPFTL